MRTIVTIAVKRTYKNQEGIYETDFIRCILWNGIAKRVSEVMHKKEILSVYMDVYRFALMKMSKKKKNILRK